MSPARTASSEGLARRATWVLRLSLVEIGVTMATAALVTLGGPSDAVSCSSFPSCLADQSALIATVHQGAAGVLLLLALVITLLAIPLRHDRPPAFLPALYALVALVITATFGMLFASGVLPTADAPIQFVFLAIVVALFGWTAVNASRAVHLRAMGQSQRPTVSPPPGI
jgi:hypothetical protein